MMNTSISRRQFLKASGLAAAGACAAGLLTGCGGSSSGSASGAAFKVFGWRVHLSVKIL